MQTEGLVYHGCISSYYLDDRVNQERIHFSFKNSTLKNTLRAVVESLVNRVPTPQNAESEKAHLDKLKEFCRIYPFYSLHS